MSKKSKAKLNVKRVVICSVLLLIIIGAIIFTMIKGKRNSSMQNKDEEGYSEEKQESTAFAKEYVDIVEWDCSMYIGTRARLTIKVKPDELLKTIYWSSSDDSVCSVDFEGNIEVKGIGNAVVTATSGNYTDSIVIIGIEKKENPPGETIVEQETFLPVCIPDENGSIVTPETDSPISSTEDTQNASVESSTAEETTEGGDTESETDKPTAEKPTRRPIENETTGLIIEPTLVSFKDTVLANIETIGYKKYKSTLDYVYIYEEDGNYLGEVIVNDDSLQIYIRTRTQKSDMAMKNLMSLVLPKSYEKAFAAYANATENITVTFENHMIRIRPALGDNHGQIIITF